MSFILSYLIMRRGLSGRFRFLYGRLYFLSSISMNLHRQHLLMMLVPRNDSSRSASNSPVRSNSPTKRSSSVQRSGTRAPSSLRVQSITRQSRLKINLCLHQQQLEAQAEVPEAEVVILKHIFQLIMLFLLVR